MARKRQQIKNEGPVIHLTGVEATLLQKPRFNGFACGYGAHGDTKYNRAKEKIHFARAMKTGE